MKESQIERTNRWLPDENRQINEGPCGTDFQLKVSESQVLVAACGKYFTNQGSNLRPLHWEYGILATGPPGMSQVLASLSNPPLYRTPFSPQALHSYSSNTRTLVNDST